MNRDDDTLTLPGARRLAARINTYWRSRGAFGVKAYAVGFRLKNGLEFFMVRSNLVNGNPRELR